MATARRRLTPPRTPGCLPSSVCSRRSDERAQRGRRRQACKVGAVASATGAQRLRGRTKKNRKGAARGRRRRHSNSEGRVGGGKVEAGIACAQECTVN